jgi:hypothetical protein
VATDLTSDAAREPEAAPEAPVEAPVAPPALAPPAADTGPRPHRVRFAVVYGGLAVVLGAAIAGVGLYATDSLTSGPAWSSWKPSGGGLGAARQIASHVAPAYRLPDGTQIVDVIANGPIFSNNGQKIPVPLLVQRGPKGKVLPDTITQMSDSDTLTYSLCGLGQSCSIATGKPSVRRGTLVRREILELALYTFKYVQGVKHIVAFLPPSAGTSPTYVVYLQKSDLEDQLHTPLTQTLGRKVPLPAQITSKEQHQVDALTETRTYKFGLSQTQQGEAVLVLDPLQA